MCGSQEMYMTQIITAIIGIAVWSFAFIGIGSLYNVKAKRSLYIGWGIYIAGLVAIFVLAALWYGWETRTPRM
jgi:hypothetical protein